MARSITDIKTQITSKYVAEMAAIGETINPASWSVTNLQRLFIYVVAFGIWVLENLFDTHKTEITQTIANKNPHTLKWYAKKVKDFQLGYNVVEDADYYDNTGLSIDVIEASKVVAYVAVTEEAESLNIKVARETAGDLAPLTNTQLLALQAYVAKIKDAGVFVTFVNQAADSLKLNLQVFYNPLLIDSNGVEIASGAETVKLAVKNHLKNLPFNGVFAVQTLIDAIQAVVGVVYIKPNEVQVRSDDAAPYETVDVYYLPASGYLRFINDADLTLTFTPYAS